MPREVRYLTYTDIKKKQRVTEHVEVKLATIRYKNAKNRIVKFDARKKLKVEVVFRVKRGVKWVTEKSASYGLPLRKRKKPVSEKIIHNQIQKKQLSKLSRGHMIVNTSEPLHNLYSWSYFYQDKTKVEKAALRKKKGAKAKREKELLKKARVNQLKKKLRGV